MALSSIQSVLTPVRQKGREALNRLGLPTRHQEAWRLTDLRRLEGVSQLPISTVSSKSPDTPPVVDGTLRLVLDGISDPLEGVNLPEELTVLKPHELEQMLGHTLCRCGYSDDWLTEFNRASTHQILALRVRGNVPPLELIITTTSGLTATRVVILVEEEAEVDLLQVFIGKDRAAHSHILEVHLGQEARLNHGLVACADGIASLLTQLAVEQEPHSQYRFTSVMQGWFLGRLESRVVQVGGQATTNLKGLAVADGEQQLAVHTAVRFEGPEGELDQLQKCLAAGRSHTIFSGAIAVPRQAQHTNAAQLSRNLLLSERARVDTKPELEILADDVRCIHGATVSQLQEDELFYLKSRGISASEAAVLLLRGACQEVVDTLPVHARVWQPLERVLKGLIS
ncbi:Fe-S cluster assembly protein SufD [Synechococcus sp. M16CYN]|uniref:Fe-S cluster assembly protein SufD n=1 Tax=Synechococcus sp. M16CYN TaxID=3103139 RepID=UPI0030DEAABA